MRRWVSVSESQAKLHPKYGIKGIAAFFRAMLVISPSLWLLSSIGNLMRIVEVRGSVASADYILMVPPIAFFLWSSWNAKVLGKLDRRFFVSFYAFLAIGPVLLIVANLLWMTNSGLRYNMTEVATNFLTLCIAWAFWSLLTVAYLMLSRRINVTLRHLVLQTDPLHESASPLSKCVLANESASTRPQASITQEWMARPVDSPSSAASPRIDTSVLESRPEAALVASQEEFWSGALAEFDGPSRRLGLWARAFAEAQGDEAVAKATYLSCRAVQLQQEDQARVADRQREMAQKEARRTQELREAQALEAQRVYLSLPKGKCPNSMCNAVIPMASQGCPKCSAVFEKGAAWSVLPLGET